MAGRQYGGFPDYARLAVQAGQLLATITGNIFGNPSSGAIDCNGFGFLNISCNDIGGTANFWVQVLWYTDQSLSVQVASQGMTIPPGSQNAKQFPCITGWATVQNVYLQGVHTDQPVTAVYGTNQVFTSLDTAMVGQPMGVFNGSVGASGGTGTITTTTVAPAKITLGIWHDVNSQWVATLAYWDRVAHNFSVFYEFDGATYIRNVVVTIGVPPTFLQLIVTNNDTVARNVIAFITEAT